MERDYYIPRKHNHTKAIHIDDDLIRRIKDALPPQPWPKGTSARVADELNISMNMVQQAIEVLINRCDVYAQRYGILYDKEGNVVG